MAHGLSPCYNCCDLLEVSEVDWIAVKGKTEPAAAYRLLGPAGEIKQERIEARDLR